MLRIVLLSAVVLGVVYSLPEGVQTVLKGHAQPLSRGQAARLVLARAILMEPRLIIIDGILDRIDESTIDSLLKEITGPKAPWSLLVLTHESHIMEYFSKAYRLQHGSLVDHTKERTSK